MMAGIKLCEWGIVMNPFATDAQLRARLIEHHRTCPEHGSLVNVF